MDLVRKLSGWPNGRRSERRVIYRIGRWLAAGLIVSGLAWHFGPEMWLLLSDRQALERFIAGLGWWGPLALIVLNIVQIVVAPVPGYAVQAAAGYLFGAFWGGVWSVIGLLGGAGLAMGLARGFGRRLVEPLLGTERLARWEQATHSSSTILWFVLLAAPIGDAPYFLAGLSRVSYAKVLLLTLTIRAPTVFVVAAIGAGVVWLAWWQLALIFGLLAGLFALFLRYQAHLLRWIDRTTLQHIAHHGNPGNTVE